MVDLSSPFLSLECKALVGCEVLRGWSWIVCHCVSIPDTRPSISTFSADSKHITAVAFLTESGGT